MIEDVVKNIDLSNYPTWDQADENYVFRYEFENVQNRVEKYIYEKPLYRIQTKDGKLYSETEWIRKNGDVNDVRGIAVIGPTHSFVRLNYYTSGTIGTSSSYGLSHYPIDIQDRLRDTESYDGNYLSNKLANYYSSIRNVTSSYDGKAYLPSVAEIRMLISDWSQYESIVDTLGWNKTGLRGPFWSCQFESVDNFYRVNGNSSIDICYGGNATKKGAYLLFTELYPAETINDLTTKVAALENAEPEVIEINLTTLTADKTLSPSKTNDFTLTVDTLTSALGETSITDFLAALDAQDKNIYFTGYFNVDTVPVYWTSDVSFTKMTVGTTTMYTLNSTMIVSTEFDQYSQVSIQIPVDNGAVYNGGLMITLNKVFDTTELKGNFETFQTTINSAIASLESTKLSKTEASSTYASNSTVSRKQDMLYSGTNIKTINGESVLGSGNITIDTSVLNATGNSTEKAMSQKAVTDAIVSETDRAVVKETALESRIEAHESITEQAAQDASEANAYAQQAYSRSTEAINTANTAKNAVATLEGLSNTTTAQQTLAATVTQIEQNTTDVNTLKSMFVYMTEAEYEALALKDPDKIYMLYEE